MRPKSWPGNPCDCTLVGRKAPANAITFQVCPIQKVTMSLSTCMSACRMRGVALVKKLASVPTGGRRFGLNGELPTKSISKFPLTRTPPTSGAAKRRPRRVPRELKTVRPLSPGTVPFRKSVG